MANNQRTADLVIRGKDQFSPVIDKATKAQDRFNKEVQATASLKPADLRKFYLDNAAAVERLHQQIRENAIATQELTRAEGDNRRQIGEMIVARGKMSAQANDLETRLLAVRAATRGLTTDQQGGLKGFLQRADAMQAEGAAARALAAEQVKLAAAREQANTRLRGMINERLNNPVRSNFSSLGGAEGRIDARNEAEMSATIQRAYAQRERETARMEAIQKRLNSTARSGFADWSRYADQISRIAAEEQKATAIAERKAAIQARLNAGAVSGFAAWSRSAAGLQQESAAAGAAATQLNLVDAAAKRATVSQKGLQSQVNSTTGALDRQGGRQRGDSGGRRGESQDVELYGLKPYQMVNLGYQVNDVVSGLAMGQAPLQILAQQAGQIAQIWPNMMVGLVRSIPQLALLATALSGPVAAMMRVSSEAETLRGISQQLDLSGDAGAYDAEQLAAITNGMREYGIATADARAITADFIKNGLPTEQLESFARTAQNMADVLGGSAAENAAKLTKGFTGGIDAVIELDRELNVLTASQLENILAMADAGDEAGALETAYDAIENRYDDVADKARGPWSQAWNNLGTAWNNFVGWLANTMPIEMAVAAMNKLGEAVAFVTGLIADFSGGASPGQALASEGDALDLRRQTLETAQEQARLQEEMYRNAGNNEMAAALATEIAQRREALGLLDQERVALEQRQREYASSYGPQLPPAVPVEPVTITDGPETQRDLKDEILDRRTLNSELDSQTEKLAEQARLAGLSTREQFVQNQLADAARAAKELDLTLTQEQTDAITAQAGATYDALDAEKARSKAAKDGLTEREQLEKRVNDLMDYRKALQEQIEIYTETGNVEEAEKLKLVLADVNTQTVAAIDSTIRYLSALDGPEIQAAIANLQAMRLGIQRGADDLNTKFLPSAEDLNDQLSDIGGDAFGAFAEALAKGENAADALFNALRQGIAQFLIDIGMAIVKQALFNAISGGTAGGGVGGAISSAITGLFHAGGVVGEGSSYGSRMVNPAVFSGATRYHGGGVVGSNGKKEVPIIALEDEEVITSDNPRHIKNAGASQQPINMKTVNIFDPTEVLEAALATEVGERVMLNWMSRNPTKIGGALG